jgi:activating signal cointegrator complex subunit 2
LIESSLQKIKESLIKDLDIGNQDSCEPIIRKLDHLLHLIPAVGFFFAVGSDLVDSLAIAFVKVSSKAQQTFTLFVYLSLVSLVRLPSPNFSLLSDHLYSLKTNARALKAQNRPSLLASVVSNTPFIRRLEKMSISSSDSETSEFPKPPRDLSAGLLEFNSSRTRPVHGRSKAGKGKARQAANEALDVVHIHRMSKISQVQDLFPDLGSGFITKLLDEYDEDVEIVTAHLLEDSLPEHLVNLDRSEQLQIQGHDNFENRHHTTAVFSPRSTPPLPERRNVFDNDEFDNLAVDASKLHIGKARQDLTADHLLSSSRTDKAAILAALARFDSDDDERDDTYDAADVGGTVDNSLDTDRDAAAAEDLAERRLFQTWKANPACFERDATTRKSQARAALKRETKWTDEAIEGWAIMLQREPVRVKNLERRLGEWRGEQQSISRSGWTEHATDDSGAEGELPARGGGYHGRGRGARGTAAGGGAGSERGTQRARRGKEVRGSHNRREGRAKKMARGMA